MPSPGPYPDRCSPVEPLSFARAVLHVVFVVCVIAFGFWALYRLASVVLVLTLAALFAYVHRGATTRSPRR
jgi:hypothetical protein